MKGICHLNDIYTIFRFYETKASRAIRFLFYLNKYLLFASSFEYINRNYDYEFYY